ncbi:MAG: PAS domain-containing protein, partial [Raoultibacter sp.]
MDENISHKQSADLGTLPCGKIHLVLGDDPHLAEATAAYCALSGYTGAQLLEAPLCGQLATLVFEDDRVRFAAEMKEIAAGSRLCARYRMRKKDGSLAWHMAYAARVRMTEEGALGTLLVFDITATSDAPVCTRGKNGQDTPFDQASLRML